VQIVSGVKAGEQVVISGGVGLEDKAKVRIEKAGEKPEGEEKAGEKAGGEKADEK
jgi:tetrahydrodipicolinate N-succinyltransferase